MLRSSCQTGGVICDCDVERTVLVPDQRLVDYIVVVDVGVELVIQHLNVQLVMHGYETIVVGWRA